MSLEKTVRMNILFEFYQTLLTDKQRQYMSLYYQEDLSLGEIAEEIGVSRQAVYDTIRRTEKILEEYETNLNLVAISQKNEDLFEQIEGYVNQHYPQDKELLALIQSRNKEYQE